MYKTALAAYEADKHFSTSQNSETFISQFQLAAELQPARVLLKIAAKS